MGRLVVHAVTGEWKDFDLVYDLVMYVSVSRADTGEPVTGLTERNFRVSTPGGPWYDFEVTGCTETMWETGDNEPSGCYTLSVRWRHDPELNPSLNKWQKGTLYRFGVQARVLQANPAGDPETVADMGQTAIVIESLGE